jgi:hypothetical protein
MKHASILAILCLVLVPVASFAQGEPGWNKSSLGANFEVSLPVGDFSNVAGTGYGGSVRFQYGSDARTAFTATAGYIAWGKKDLGSNASLTPQAFTLLFGGKYYLAPSFFGTIEGGAYFVDYTYEGPAVGVYGNTTRFMLPIGLGYQKNGFEIAARYMLLDVDFNAFSFTVGYNFAL